MAEHVGTVVTVDGHRRNVIRCACGARIELWDSWANGCECGREYNGSGQELAPREQWGEETGETAADFINLDSALED